ncbi:Fc.00g062250.m01.CDS01 [Cosmosporella sp. VM-42]
MSSPKLLDAGASRPRSGFLTPSSEGSLNRNDVPMSPEGRKRKRSDSVAMDHLLKPSIALKPHPPNLRIQPRVLQPLMVLPRESLPLACIDFNASHSDLSQSRFFESHIKILDLESRMGAVPVVLLARNESTRTVYAIERQESGLYVACRLGPWIELDQLAKRATALCRDRLRPTAKRELQAQTSSISMATPQMHKDQKQKRAAIEAIQSLVRKRARSQSVSTFEDATRQDETMETNTVVGGQLPSPVLKQEELPDVQSVAKEQTLEPVAVPETAGAVESPRQTADDILESIRTHYSEALYKSLGSLAYFAKGPLSRARSAFHLDLESSLDMGDLIDFLKSLILTTVQIDKKYRETVPEVISKMKTTVESSDEGRKKKRRSKKMKLGKDGLYPYEEDHVRKWWTTNKPELKDDETDVPAQQIKSLISMLRTRETQLQMILILEILALEPLRAAEDADESQLPALPGAIESQDQMAPPPPKKRNKHNLPVLVDVHADRLTIWQSTISDEQLLLEDSQVSRHPGDDNPQNASSEPLKDFCVDVIVPFFSARLPELCDSINRKLGGPVVIQPSKSRSLKRSNSKREQKPGAATQRPAPAKAPRTLQRALSTEQQRRSVSRGPSNMIALMRSAASTSVPGIKREGSEPATLKAMMKAEANLMNKRSGSLSRSSSMTNLQDARAKKQALVDAELKDAISALRKPNREVVGKALAEAEERRVSTGFSAKKIKKPGRSSLGSSIVKATPANYRFKDMFAGKSESAVDLPLMSTEEVIPPSSVPSMAPSTGMRVNYRDAFPDSASPLNGIGRTPTKASAAASFLRRPANEEPAIPNSPLMQRRTVSAEQLFLAAQGQRRLSFNKNEGIFATPNKTKAKEIKDTENLQNEPPKNVSIYQALGWDDEYDDL